MKTVHMLVISLMAALAPLTLVACGGAAEVGEACDTSGSVDECAEGAVCDSTDGEGAVCLALCEGQEDCASDEDCNGVSGSNLKACHPKDDDQPK